MTQPKKPVVRLDALAAEVAGVVELCGQEHNVRQMDGDAYRTVAQIQSGELEAVENWPLVARLVPSLPAADVGKLTPSQVGAILAVADGNIQAVATMLAAMAEAADPNGAGPADASPPA